MGRFVAPAAGRYEISGTLPDLPAVVTTIAMVLPGETPREALARVVKAAGFAAPPSEIVVEFNTEDVAAE